MPESIVQGLFGPTPYELQMKQQQGLNADSYRYAQLDPMARGIQSLHQAGGMLGGAGAEAFGLVNPQVEQAKAAEMAVQGIDVTNPDAILQRAQQIQDPRLKMRLIQYAQQMKAQQQKVLMEERNYALSTRKQDFQEQQMFELKKTEAEARIRQNDEKIADARTTNAERIALQRESNQIKLMLGQMANAIAQQKVDSKGKSKGLSATAQKELFEADEAVIGAQAGSKALNEALSINNKAMGFKGAGIIADVGSVLPDFARPKTFDVTLDLDNIVQQSVLPQLKSIFGANPTEGERKILLEVAGSSSKPAPVRKGIFERAQRAADARAKFNKEKADKLRAGTYFDGAALEEPTVAEIVQTPEASGSWSIRKK